MKIQNIKNDIMELRGANVQIFGRPVTLEENVDKTAIDILDVLDALDSYEKVDLTVLELDADDELEEIEIDDVQQYLDFLDEQGELEEVVSDNSYNWGSPVSNDFNFNIYRNIMAGTYLIEFKVHRFGDVRGNYTETALLEFDHEHEFFEVLHESDKHVEHNGYDLNISIFNDMIEVYDMEGSHVGEIVDIDDLDDLIEEHAVELIERVDDALNKN